jgi:hypothetical protein
MSTETLASPSATITSCFPVGTTADLAGTTILSNGTLYMLNSTCSSSEKLDHAVLRGFDSFFTSVFHVKFNDFLEDALDVIFLVLFIIMGIFFAGLLYFALSLLVCELRRRYYWVWDVLKPGFVRFAAGYTDYWRLLQQKFDVLVKRWRWGAQPLSTSDSIMENHFQYDPDQGQGQAVAVQPRSHQTASYREQEMQEV